MPTINIRGKTYPEILKDRNTLLRAKQAQQSPQYEAAKAAFQKGVEAPGNEGFTADLTKASKALERFAERLERHGFSLQDRANQPLSPSMCRNLVRQTVLLERETRVQTGQRSPLTR